MKMIHKYTQQSCRIQAYFGSAPLKKLCLADQKEGQIGAEGQRRAALPNKLQRSGLQTSVTLVTYMQIKMKPMS